MAIPAAFLFVLLKSRIEETRGGIEQFASRKMIALNESKA